MSDLISRAAAIDALNGLCDIVCQYSKKQRSVMCGACPLGSAFDTIEEVPSAQPEITHCGNCKHHSDEKPGMVYCPEIAGGWVKNDCFCAMWEGKR